VRSAWGFCIIIQTLLLLCLLIPTQAQEQEQEQEQKQPSDSESEQQQAKSYPDVEHRGQLQLQVNGGSLGSVRENSFVPANNGLAPFPASTRVFERRFRPAWDVWFSPRFSLQTEFEIDNLRDEFDGDFGNFKVAPLDLLLRYDFDERTNVQLGRFKVPFGWEGLRSSRTINTVERSDATVYMYPERDVGISFSHDREGVVNFSVGTFLGQPRSNGDANGSLEVIGRAVFPISDSLQIGASGHLGSFRPTGGQTDIPVRRLGTELHYEDGPFRFESEAIWSDGYNTASRSDTKAFGYYFTSIYRVADPLEFVLSYDWFDPDTGSVDSALAANSTNSRDRKLIGFNYYLKREPIHRIMLNYEMKQSLEGAPLDNWGFRLRYQIGW
jgi:phosphate-selective porin O/P